ncbi:MAG: hypothetical protein AB1439_02805 [candidate division FCPU426 bacterium]
MKLKAVTLILFGLLNASAAWPDAGPAPSVSEEGQFLKLVEFYYARPQPRSLPGALKYFVEKYSRLQPAEGDDELLRMAAFARFFAVLGERHSEIWRHAELLFNQASWPKRQALLEIFSRNQDESLRNSLKGWAAAEEDPDRRILLERCLLAQKPVLDVMDAPPENLTRLAEQWACFFAVGDVRVIELSLAVLAAPAAEGGADLRAQRLRETALQMLLQQARVHALVRESLAKTLATSENEALLPLRQSLACQALQAGDAGAFDQWLPAAWISRLPAEQRAFFEACSEVLRSRSQAVPGKVAALAAVNRVQAEWLKAHHAYLRLREGEAAGRTQPLAGQGRELLLKAKNRLLQDPETAFYTLWSLETDPPQARAESFYHLQVAARAGQDRRWLALIRLLPQEAQADVDGKMFRWTDRHPQWIPVESGFLDARIRQAVQTEDLAQFLDRFSPQNLAKFSQSGSQPLIRASYEPVPDAELWNNVLEPLFPGQRHTLSRLLVDVDASTQQPVRVQAEVVVQVDGRIVARGEVEQIFYDPGPDSLAWLEALR